jgi:predicted ester cyclase
MLISKLIDIGVDHWNRREKDSFLADFDPRCEITGPSGLVLRGHDGAELLWHIYHDAFPDNRVTVQAVLETTDRVTVEGIFEGTHTGILRRVDGSQVAISGRAARIRYAAVHTYRHRRITTLHLYFDEGELFAQLGIVTFRRS